MASSHWPNQIREPKSSGTLISNQLSVLPHTERLVPNSGNFKTSTCTNFDIVKLGVPFLPPQRLFSSSPRVPKAPGVHSRPFPSAESPSTARSDEDFHSRIWSPVPSASPDRSGTELCFSSLPRDRSDWPSVRDLQGAPKGAGVTTLREFHSTLGPSHFKSHSGLWPLPLPAVKLT